MKKIEMVDLKSQYLNIKNEIDSSIQEVIDSVAFIKGKPVQTFQENLQNYLNVNHVISCANGTDALLLALMALDLKEGDEIITTAFTFVATAEVIVLLGLKPVFVDVDSKTFTIDIQQIKKAITPRSRVIIPVHLFGQCADMQAIMKIALQHDLYVIEDSAQATGAEYILDNGTRKKAGTLGNIGCTSFFPSKNLGCFGDGGAVFTNDARLADKMNSIANHGSKVRYHYDEIGINSRLDTIQAAILNVKLNYLDTYNTSRQKAADFYDAAFNDNPKVQIPFRSNYSTHIFNQYTLVTKGINRNDLQESLKNKGIPTMIYYPLALHLQKAYQFLGYKKGSLPITENLCDTVISLPMHTELDQEQLNYITQTILLCI